MKIINREFNFTGEARDFGGTEAYHYENENWIIGVWATFPSKYTLPQGTLENMTDGRFEFTLEDSWYLTYARVLESNYDGLGRRYDESDTLIPKYVIQKIKQIAHEMLRDQADWQLNKL
ncbi:hypothetical protein [Brevibacillus brevis]|uniref:hypothetical protein n=1 Tax=Brevibacillus brevis TaxID=1393 RepID=UPI0007D8A8C4|nr:hypothetical protein [Brevibacillus brevis]